jgi:hypothetical protein
MVVERDKNKRKAKTNGGTIKRSYFDWDFEYNMIPYTRAGPLYFADWQPESAKCVSPFHLIVIGGFFCAFFS